MGLPVVDEIYERYRRLSHADLYRQLRAGSPTEVEALAAVWRRTEDALRALATALRTDLDALSRTWIGTGSNEYQRRLGLVATWTGALIDEAVAIRTGLSLMSGMLADAQSRAEPDSGTATDELTADGVLGPALGHVGTATERARAHERLARLVAELAAGYAVVDHRTWPATPPAAPADLPGTAGSHHDHHHKHDSKDHGTRLAGHIRHHRDHVIPPGLLSTVDAGPVGAAAAPQPVAGPANLARPATLAGTGAGPGPGPGLAGAPSAGHLVGSQPTAATHESGATAAPIPSMLGPGGGTAIAGAPPPVTVAGYHRPFDDMSWAAGESTLWVDSADDPPPAVLGDPAE
jgi:hypothetical protein